jgi:hypothetical protein
MDEKSNQNQMPQQGEQTGRQAATLGVALFGSGFDLGTPQPSTYATYRKMRFNPTIALARSVATAPLRASSISIESENVQQDITDFIDVQIKNFWPELLRNILFALDYGWQPFEKVWSVENGKYIYKKFKPLLVDKTQLNLDQKTGRFAGLKQDNVNLPPQNCYIFTNEQECDNFYGRSRHENIRTTAWLAWDKTLERFCKYLAKIAGITPMMKYPPGQSLDKTGATKENFDIATALLAALGRGDGIAMPDVPPKWIGDNLDALVRAGLDLSKLKAWEISFLETGRDHSQGFSTALRHLESMMMRGWLVPERVATEGQMGTKAESATQTETAMAISDVLFDDIIRSVNWYIVNPLLVYNFGPQYENKVYIKKGGLAPELQEFYRKVMERVLGEPINLGFFAQWTDIDVMLDTLQWPRKKQEQEQNEELPNFEDETLVNPQIANRVATMMANMNKNKENKK